MVRRSSRPRTCCRDRFLRCEFSRTASCRAVPLGLGDRGAVPRKNQHRIPIIFLLPPSLYTKENVGLITEYLDKNIPHSELELIQVKGEEHCRLHYYFDQPGEEEWKPDTEKLEQEVRELVKPWDDRLRDVLTQDFLLR